MMNFNRIPWRNAAIAALAALLAISAGCARSHYRRKADLDAYAAIGESASMLPRPTDYYTIDTDPQSRIYDPFDPDNPPIPPDDPVSHRIMQITGGDHPKRGYKHWYKNGFAPAVENPDWCAFLNVQEDESGTPFVFVDSRYAVELALRNSRDYQTELEDLYLSALDVSSERFRFETQFFGGYRTQYTADGPDRPGGGGVSSSLLDLSTFTTPGSTSWQMQRFFTTGADVAVGLANSLVWQFSGPDDYTGTTLMDFAFVQPLLRAAGRDRIMETLTLSERTLLANVRQMERFRRGFYLEVTTGQNAGPGPQRRGGQFGAGLAGFTGVGTVGFAGGGGGGGGGGAGGGTGAQGAGGLLGLLQQQQEIRNAEENVDGLRRVYREQLELLREERIAGFDPEQAMQVKSQLITSELQVAQARQAVLNAESALINTKNQYHQALDVFKTTLGLPPSLCLEVRDPMLDEFTRLVDQATKDYLDRIDVTRRETGATGQIILDKVVEEEQEPGGVVNRVIRSIQDVATELRNLRPQTEQIQPTLDHIVEGKLPEAHRDIENLKKAIPRRIDDLKRLKELYLSELAQARQQPDAATADCWRAGCPENCRLLPITDIDPAIFDTARLENLPADLEQRLDQLIERFYKYPERISAVYDRIDAIIEENTRLESENNGMSPQGVELRRQVLQIVIDIQGILIELNDDVRALQLLLATARAESIELPQVELTSPQAMAIARQYRRDWMNARASLVDAWRLIRFNADDLQSTLDIVFSGDIQNKSDNPLRIRGTTGRLRVGVEFDAPLTRLLERNNYRQSLIEYQRARRGYMEFEDTISQGLRATLRTLEANRINFENRRFALFNSVRQIQLTEESAEQQVLIQSSTGQAGGARNTATRDAVQAQDDLLTAKNNLLSFWVNFEVLRRGLDFNLGTMQLDAEGNWIDPGPIGPRFGYPSMEACYEGVSDAELLGPGEILDEALPQHPQFDELPPAPQSEPEDDENAGSVGQQDVDIGLPSPRRVDRLWPVYPDPSASIRKPSEPTLTLEEHQQEQTLLPLLPPASAETAERTSTGDAGVKRR